MAVVRPADLTDRSRTRIERIAAVGLARDLTDNYARSKGLL